MTRRDLQMQAMDKKLPWEPGESFEQCAPCGAIYPVAKVGHLSKGRIQLKVNDQIRQDADIGEMIYNVPKIISFLSQSVELAPGEPDLYRHSCRRWASCRGRSNGRNHRKAWHVGDYGRIAPSSEGVGRSGEEYLAEPKITCSSLLYRPAIGSRKAGVSKSIMRTNVRSTPHSCKISDSRCPSVAFRGSAPP